MPEGVVNMIANLVDVLFGCSHKRYTFPITAKGAARHTAAASATGTYVVCLDCGKEFAYDWDQMKVVSHKRVTASPIQEPAHSRAA